MAGRKVLVLLVAVVVLAGLPERALAQIVLSQDFDSGSLDVAQSTVDGLQVTLEPRRYYGKDDKEWGFGDWNWVWVYFKASQVNGKTVTFRILKAGSVFSSHSKNHRYVYSYDNQTWSYFDNASVVDGYYTFDNNDPFTADEVYVAFTIPYPVALTQQHTATVKASPFVSPTASGNADLVIGQTAGGTDSLGRTVPKHDIYGYQITDPSVTGPKQKIVLLTGVHSGETLGNRLFQGMVDFVIGDDPRAAELRQLAVFYCYPSADPDGRWAGYFRSNPENPTLNHNRYWDDPTGFTNISTITSAMKADTGGAVDYFFDCHNHYGYNATYFWYYLNNNDETFFQALKQLDPFIRAKSDLDEPSCNAVCGACGCLADGWSLSKKGLSARFAYTPEAGPILVAPPERYAELGQFYMLALLESLRAQAAEPDGGPADAGAEDAGAADSALPLDAGPADTSIADGSSDGGVATDDGGCSCSLEPTSAIPPLAPLVLMMLFRRRTRRS